MRQFVAETGEPFGLRAWLNPEDPADVIADPHVPRADGWRVVIECAGQREPVRSTWELTIEEALDHVTCRWPCELVWRDEETGETVVI